MKPYQSHVIREVENDLIESRARALLRNGRTPILKHAGYTKRDYDAMVARWRVYGLAVAVLCGVLVAMWAGVMR